MDRAIVKSREELEHERDRRYSLTYYVRKNCNNREADRADYAFAQLQVEKDDLVRRSLNVVNCLFTTRPELTPVARDQ